MGDETDKDYFESTNRHSTVQWVNKDDPHGSDPDSWPTGPVMGTEPELNFAYSLEGTGAYCFTEDTPINVEVHLGSRNITEQVYFGWVSCDTNHNHASQIVEDTVTNSSVHKERGERYEKRIFHSGNYLRQLRPE